MVDISAAHKRAFYALAIGFLLLIPINGIGFGLGLIKEAKGSKWLILVVIIFACIGFLGGATYFLAYATFKEKDKSIDKIFMQLGLGFALLACFTAIILAILLGTVCRPYMLTISLGTRVIDIDDKNAIQSGDDVSYFEGFGYQFDIPSEVVSDSSKWGYFSAGACSTPSRFNPNPSNIKCISTGYCVAPVSLNPGTNLLNGTEQILFFVGCKVPDLELVGLGSTSCAQKTDDPCMQGWFDSETDSHLFIEGASIVPELSIGRIRSAIDDSQVSRYDKPIVLTAEPFEGKISKAKIAFILVMIAINTVFIASCILCIHLAIKTFLPWLKEVMLHKNRSSPDLEMT